MHVALVPNEVGARNAIAASADELATVVSASETHNPRNVNRTIEESLAGIETVARLRTYAGCGTANSVSISEEALKNCWNVCPYR
jgi:hydroxymethylglutaryl-CoA lyase